jgi:hypothetical protein
MIHTDGKQTIANAPDRGVADIERERLARLQDKVEAEEFQAKIDAARPTASERIREARALRQHALDVEAIRALPSFAPSRGPQANGVEWNDGYCNCGVAICDSPAGDKCWDCFNFDPSE